MLAGTAKTDITPTRPVRMDGMIRAHRSVGVHDPLFARALALGNSRDPNEMLIVISADICALRDSEMQAARRAVMARTGLPLERIIIATTHTHSGPATFGFFTPVEAEYAVHLGDQFAALACDAVSSAVPAAVGCASGREETISHYRRLLADDGQVVMNWEEFPAERIVGPLGEADPEVGVLKVVAAQEPRTVICLLVNHAGHPNIMSGDNYLLSADYPGAAMRLLEQRWGSAAIFVNGAQGSVDIDGLRHRDWEGMERAGMALAQAVTEIACAASTDAKAELRTAATSYTVPTRTVSAGQWVWAQEILRRTGGKIQALADGIGDDYRAVFYSELKQAEGREIPVEQICFGLGDAAFITFPGELYTEIGVQIKAQSPFERTYILGLSNGYIGYVPTRQAIAEGGYAEDVRRVDDSAEETVVRQSLALLGNVRALSGNA